MFMVKSVKIIIAVLLTFLLVGGHVFATPTLQNGAFSSPLDTGWTAYDVVTIDNGVAVLGEDAFATAFLARAGIHNFKQYFEFVI